MKQITIFLLTFTIFLSACTKLNTTPSLTEKDKEIIRLIPDAYTKGFLEDDSSAILELFSEDAVLIPPRGGSPVIGLKAIREFFWPTGSPPLRVNKFTKTQAETDGAGNIAYTRGITKIEFSKQYDGVWNTYSKEGNYLIIFKKKPDNNWYIFRAIWNQTESKLLVI